MSDPESAQELRRRAEQALPLRAPDLSKMADTDIMALMYELQVHQVELEMQNEELQRAQVELQIAAERCCIRCVPRWNAFCMISLLPRSHNTVSFTAASFHPAAVFRSWSV